MILIIESCLSEPPSEILCFRDVTLFSKLFIFDDILLECKPGTRAIYWNWLKSHGAHDFISQLVLEKGTDNHHLLPALEWLMGNNVRGSLRSMFELSHILPSTADSAVSTPFAFYGTLRDHLALVERQGLEVAVSDQAGFICDTITVRAKAKIGFKLNGADASSQGVLVSTSAS